MPRSFCASAIPPQVPEVVAQSADTASWRDYFLQRAQTCHAGGLRHFYAAGLPDPGTPLDQVRFMAVDFETTGLDPARHAIVSVGMVPFSLTRIRPADGRYWVVKPSRPLHASSVVLHGITHDQVAEAPPLAALLDDMLAALAGHVPVVHYRPIERPFLDAACRNTWGESCLFPVIDTMDIEARHTRQGLTARLRRLLGMGQSSIRLADSRTRYGLPAYGSHHAKLDALATAELLLAQVARHYGPDTPVGSLWV